MRLSLKGYKGRYSSYATRGTFLLSLLLLLIVGTASFAFASTEKSNHASRTPVAQKTLAINGATQWANDSQTTQPVTMLSLPDAQQTHISSLFNTYYKHYNSSNSLGNPLTLVFPIDGGWLQFFEGGALYLPTQPQAHTTLPDKDNLLPLIKNGIKDPTTDVIRVPLLQALLNAGSLVPVGGAGSTLTYSDIRKATDPELMITASAADERAALTINSTLSDGAGMFVKSGVREGKDVGYVVLQSFWNYINHVDISPDGWQRDFGLPLTNVIPFTVTSDGHSRHLLLQVFTQGGLIYDSSIPVSAGQPSILRLKVGLDYIHTFGLPVVKLTAGQKIWSLGDTSILAQPTKGQELAHIGKNFPLTLSGVTRWSNGKLWYEVRVSVMKNASKGWIDSSMVTFTSPGNQAGRASFDALSPDLTTYLNSLGQNVSVTLYDETHHIYYTYNSSTQFIVASSMKVPIMLTFFDMVEQQGRDPDDNEMSLLTTMIENSNNDSASALFQEVGQSAGISAYIEKIGVTGLSPNDGSWGYSLITSQTMVNLLTLLYDGKVLNASHRSLALNLMENVETDQQAGIGDTSPSGATVALKDGWVPGPDGQWAMNSSGIVTTSKETYILSVYTQEQQSLDDGQAIARHVCSTVASLLVPS